MSVALKSQLYEFLLPAALILLATGCGGTQPGSVGAPASPASPVATSPASPSAAVQPSVATAKVRVAVQGRPDQAALELAYRRGYFEQAGIQVEEVQIDSGSQMVPQLATNNLQVGNGSPSASLFNAFNRGVNIRLVADYAHTGGPEDTSSSFLIRKELYDAGVRSMVGLKGKRIGMPGVGSSADMTLAAALEKDGLSANDVTTVQLGTGPEIVAAMTNKSVDAGIVTEPLVTDAIAKGIASILYTSGALRPGTYLSVLQYSPQFAQDQPAVATKFMVAYLRGVRDYYDAFHLKKDRQAAIDVLAKYLSLKDPKVWETAGPLYIDLNGRLDAQQLQSQADFFAKQLQGPVPRVSQFIDPQFAEAAVRSLGAR